jgi:hypothetical protein
LSVCYRKAIAYNMTHETRRKIEGRITRHLNEFSRRDADAFYKKYVFRSACNDDARALFPAMFAGYARITKRAVAGEALDLDDTTRRIEALATGRPIDRNRSTDDFLADLGYITDGSEKPPNDECMFTIVSPGSRWSKPIATGLICFSRSEINILGGTVDNFYIGTDACRIKFHRDFVRVSISDIGKRSRAR